MGLHNLAHQHLFRITMVDGQVKLKYKTWVDDPVWEPENSDGLDLFKVLITVAKLIVGGGGHFTKNAEKLGEIRQIVQLKNK